MTGQSPSDEKFASKYMDRGHELEPEARKAYETTTFNKIKNGGFYELNEWVGASPDGTVKGGGLEIKCPAYNTQMGYLIKKVLPQDYFYQVHAQMLICDFGFVDFFTYHPQLPIFKIRVKRDAEVEKKILAELEIAIKSVQETIKKLTV